MYGVKLKGRNTSIPVSSLSKSLIFRGKAVQSGGGLYSANSPGTVATMNVQYFTGATWGPDYTGSGSNERRITYWYRGSASGDGQDLGSTRGAYLTADSGFFNYYINCPTRPVVFYHTSNANTKACTKSIQEVSPGTWLIVACISFPVGEGEGSFLPRITLYCFSEIVAADLTDTYGMRAFNASGQPTFSSEKKILRIKDYVKLTGSSTPAWIGDLIYTRSFAPNPEQSVFTIPKPAFQNVDFARYTIRQFQSGFISLPFGSGWMDRLRFTSGGLTYQHRYWAYLDMQVVSSGVCRNNAGNELEFGLNVVEGYWTTQYYDTIQTSASFPPPIPGDTPNVILAKYEGFPVTIPIINAAEYD